MKKNYVNNYNLAALVTRDTPPPPVKDRPVCFCCHKTRRVLRWDDGTWTYGGYGYFCTQTCATRYANNVVKKFLNQ